MALPDYSDLEAGTPITWLASGGTKAITLTSLANDAAREGEKSATLVDGTKGMPEVLDVFVEWTCASAPANGKQVEYYFAESDVATAGSGNPGNLSGTDAGVSAPDEIKQQVGFVGALNLANSLGGGVNRQRFEYEPVRPYIIPLVVNKSGVAGSGVAGNFSITVTPYYRRLKD